MKILIEKAVIEQALEALGQWKEHDAWHKRNDWNDEDESAITALREALDPELQFVRDWNEGKVRRVSDGKVMGFAEQAEQEPVATVVDESEEQTNTMSWILSLPLPVGTKLYAAPVRTKDLTDDEIESFVSEHRMADYIYRSQAIAMCRSVIAADREKNK